MTLLPEVESAILDAVRRDHRRRARSRTSKLRSVPLRAPLIALALLLGTTTIALAASGVILTGAPVSVRAHLEPTVGYGIPTPGKSRLLPLRAPDPAGGLPWGMRVVHTTRGYLCVQIGRVDHGQLGELGIDGAFHDDGRFHALPVDAFPKDVSLEQGFNIECNQEAQTTFAGEIVGLQPNAASNARTGSPANRREISFGLLGPKAIRIAYHSGSQTHTGKLLRGLGAYLIVQRATSDRQPGSISIGFTFGNATLPARPNGALTAIGYRYGTKTCTDTGQEEILRACGLPEGPPPKPAPLPASHEPLRVHLSVRHHVVTAAVVSFRAPYPVTSARESYILEAHACHGGDAIQGSKRNLAKAATVRIAIGLALSRGCSGPMRFTAKYRRGLDGINDFTSLGAVTVHIPPGDRAKPLPSRPPRSRWMRERLREARRSGAHR
ncbi:MAG TPA: hypothetical protein VGF95_11805 [Solirubrobacteraceae bacterium]|jgi:hypothetical protein